MRLRQTALLGFILSLLPLLVFDSSFSQVRRAGEMGFSGTIERIDEERRFIVINEKKIRISQGASVLDENGNPLKIRDLRRNHHVWIEAAEGRDGLLAKKVVLKKGRERLKR